MECLNCAKPLKKHQNKYCSNNCQLELQFREYIKQWKLGKKDGNRGKKVKLISKHLRRYLVEKYRNKCCQCGWSKINPVTGAVPLEVDHIDGNATNNDESNLRLLCPNCHSLTPSFRNLNKGKGRIFRGRK